MASVISGDDNFDSSGAPRKFYTDITWPTKPE